MKPSSLFSDLFRLARPWQLLAGVLLYNVGGGIVHFLGGGIDWNVYIIGQACFTLLQLSSYYLSAYYEVLVQQDGQAVGTPVLRPILLQIAITILTIGAVLTVLLTVRGVMTLPGFFVLGLAFLLAFFYAVPPYRLTDSGYGELAQAVFIANMAPAWAFILQTGELHRLLAMLTFPLTTLYLAMGLAQSMQGYAGDLKRRHKTMMVRMGWQRAVSLHNFLILGAYLLIGLAAILGLPWSLTWPVLLTLPVGLLQLWLMYQIVSGARPRWLLLRTVSASLVGLMAYLISLALWTG